MTIWDCKCPPVTHGLLRVESIRSITQSINTENCAEVLKTSYAYFFDWSLSHVCHQDVESKNIINKGCFYDAKWDMSESKICCRKRLSVCLRPLSCSCVALQGVCASPGPDVPYWTSGQRQRGTARWQAELRSSQWGRSTCCLQLQTPEEEEELLFPWKQDHFLWSWSSSVWTVPAQQPGKDTQSGHKHIYSKTGNLQLVFLDRDSWHLMFSAAFFLCLTVLC